jgi:hypothetical protein
MLPKVGMVRLMKPAAYMDAQHISPEWMRAGQQRCMTPLPADLIELAERVVTEGARLDFCRRVELVAEALRGERRRHAGEVKVLTKRLRPGRAAR